MNLREELKRQTVITQQARHDLREAEEQRDRAGQNCHQKDRILHDAAYALEILEAAVRAEEERDGHLFTLQTVRTQLDRAARNEIKHGWGTFARELADYIDQCSGDNRLDPAADTSPASTLNADLRAEPAADGEREDALQRLDMIRREHNGVMGVYAFMGHDGNNEVWFTDLSKKETVRGISGRSLEEAADRCIDAWRQKMRDESAGERVELGPAIKRAADALHAAEGRKAAPNLDPTVDEERPRDARMTPEQAIRYRDLARAAEEPAEGEGEACFVVPRGVTGMPVDSINLVIDGKTYKITADSLRGPVERGEMGS